MVVRSDTSTVNSGSSLAVGNGERTENSNSKLVHYSSRDIILHHKSFTLAMHNVDLTT